MKGLQHIFLLDGKGGGAPLAPAQIDNWDSSKGVLWVHLNYQEKAVIDWLGQHKQIRPLISQALLSEETRPRIQPIENGLLAALRGVNLNPGADPDDMVSIRLWIEPHRIISTKSRELKSTNDVFQSLKEGTGPKSSGEFLVELLSRLAWRIGDTVESLEEQMDALEEQVIGHEVSQELRGKLAQVRRQTITLRRYLAPQRDAVSKLFLEPIEWITEENRLHFREIGDRLIRHIENLDAVRERAAVTQEELANNATERMNSRMYVLSVVAAVFLPLGFLTGLLGVNVGGIPGAEYPGAFVLFILILILITTAQIVLFRWKRWF